MLARRVGGTSDESLADFQSRLETVILLNYHLNLVGARTLPTSYHNTQTEL